MRRRTLLFRQVVWLGSSAALLAVTPAAAQAKPAAAAVTCGQRGKVSFDQDTTLADASGRKLARFSGGESAVTLLAPPVDGSALLQIETGSGHGSFRLRGFVPASELRIYTSVTVPVVAGHVWLAAGTRVTLAGASAGKVRLEKQVTAPFEQRFSASADCSALTFSPPAPPAFAVPGAARVFLLKGAQLELFEQVPPTAGALFTLKRAPSVGSVRFFSTEQRGGFVHVQYQGEVTIDAWARASELLPLPRGETADVPPSSYSLSSPPELRLSPLPRVVKTKRELALRLAAKDTEPPVGVVEPDTELYVMDTIAGWAKVLPKSLHVLPLGDQSFWLKTGELDAAQ